MQANANAKVLAVGDAIPHITRNCAIENVDLDLSFRHDKTDLELKAVQGRAEHSRLMGGCRGTAESTTFIWASESICTRCEHRLSGPVHASGVGSR